MNSLALKNGTILKNRYQIISQLGSGGFSIAYKAIDMKESNRFVAIKEFLPSSGCSIQRDLDEKGIKVGSEIDAFHEGLKRFELEAKNLSLFRHPNIVHIMDYFTENRTGYYVMEFKEGVTLDKKLREKLFTQEEIIDIIFPILEGLKEMHQRNIYHRDVKPANIFLVKNYMPMLIDFGAARKGMISKSQEFTAMLTHGYAPPEQYESIASNQGPWTDIYAVSACMYEMITGELPKNAINRVETKEPIKFPSLNDNRKFDKNFLSAIVKGLSIDKEKRPQNISDFQDIIMNGVPKRNVFLDTIINIYNKIFKKS
jgi:serine/threonine protein kinase